jgi:hypothetical protein
MTASSSMSASLRKGTAPATHFSARSRRASCLLPDKPASRRSVGSAAKMLLGRRPLRPSARMRRVEMAMAAFEEICCEMIERASTAK